MQQHAPIDRCRPLIERPGESSPISIRRLRGFQIGAEMGAGCHAHSGPDRPRFGAEGRKRVVQRLHFSTHRSVSSGSAGRSPSISFSRSSPREHVRSGERGAEDAANGRSLVCQWRGAGGTLEVEWPGKEMTLDCTWESSSAEVDKAYRYSTSNRPTTPLYNMMVAGAVETTDGTLHQGSDWICLDRVSPEECAEVTAGVPCACRQYCSCP